MPTGSSWNLVPASRRGGDDDTKPPLTDKDYILIGVTVDHSTIVLKRWGYCPTIKEVEARMGSAKKDYTRFALCSVSGMFDVPKAKP